MGQEMKKQQNIAKPKKHMKHNTKTKDLNMKIIKPKQNDIVLSEMRMGKLFGNGPANMLGWAPTY